MRSAGVALALGPLAAVCLAGCSTAKKAVHVQSSPTPSPAESSEAAPTAPSPTCPLTGQPAPSGVPNRPVYAVKVPNDTAQARGFQTGLNSADIVYEEPVEGGITRFIALYQCRDAARIEPIRSARFVDLDVLQQYGKVLFGHAGGIAQVISDVSAAAASGRLIDANYSGTPYQGDYHRDTSRAEPDNLYTSTAEIYKTAGTTGSAPAPVFTFFSATSTVTATASAAAGVSATVEPGSGAGSVVTVPFSAPAYNPTWTWNAGQGVYLRSYGSSPHKLTDGSQIQAANIVIQLVSVTPSQYAEDITGTKENLVGTVGTGKAVVCRLGACVTGTWSRPALSSVTQYLDPSGAQIPLQPGSTWVELEPNTQTPSMS
ncbi:MAG TPA: DUF3048 domain-containing protein [Actinomycetota bacterium]|nr:DUF3048 domain-containing protein [Actinomycetota bacterium]